MRLRVRLVTLGLPLQILGMTAVMVTRTFLSWSLAVEMAGRWPWQPAPTSHPEVVA